ncbi:MAG: hypothetical protein WDO17_09960 [Alphaproteobacteria bacterium]
MLPDIRAVVAAIAAAVALLIVAFGAVATFRVAQESRAGSLHADLAQRGHAAPPEPRPIVVIETPGPTLLAKTPESASSPDPVEQTTVSPEPLVIEKDHAPQSAGAAAPETSLIASVPPEPDPDIPPAVVAAAPLPDSPPVVASEPSSDPPAQPAIVAAAPQAVEEQPAPPALAAFPAIGGPSPEEIAQAEAHAKAQRKAAERARARKAAAEKNEQKKKARAARIARERKLAAQRAAAAQKQQASASSPQGAIGFPSSGGFSSAPFGSTFDNGGATNRR